MLRTAGFCFIRTLLGSRFQIYHQIHVGLLGAQMACVCVCVCARARDCVYTYDMCMCARHCAMHVQCVCVFCRRIKYFPPRHFQI